MVAPGGLVLNTVDEVPPPSYTTVTGGTPVVTCRVCQVKRLVLESCVILYLARSRLKLPLLFSSFRDVLFKMVF